MSKPTKDGEKKSIISRISKGQILIRRKFLKVKVLVPVFDERMKEAIDFDRSG